MRENLYYLVSFILVMIICTLPALAQDAAVVDPNAEKEPPIRFETPYDYFDQSLMFSESEILKIQAALVGVENEAINSIDNEDPTSEEINTPTNRFIKLGGIAYTSPDRWMIWINDQRVTPNNLLPEIVEIQVRKDYVDLKWFDEMLRKIIKIRLRPNWAYEIRTGILIPG